MFIVLPLKDGKRRIIDTKNITSITESVNGGVCVHHRVNQSLACDTIDTSIEQLAEALKAKYVWRAPTNG